MLIQKLIMALFISLSFLIYGNFFGIATNQNTTDNKITCNENGCRGTYNGPEFVNGSDVAHQFSNKMSGKVGNQLKALYAKKQYVKVDLANIKMSSKNMDNRGNVIYTLDIPFVSVTDSCKAFTAFDHRGGWGHQISKESVLTTFKHKNNLKLIELNTPEGLQEFWLQWIHNSKQANCK